MYKGVSWWALGAVIVLAGLDLAAAMLAKEYSLRPCVLLMAAGLVTSAALFVVYVKSLSYGDLWVVTFGWVAFLQVGVVVIDRTRFGTSLSIRSVVLIAVLVVAQVLLMTGSGSRDVPTPPIPHDSAVPAAPADLAAAPGVVLIGPDHRVGAHVLLSGEEC